MKGAEFRVGIYWEPAFCANCGKLAGRSPVYDDQNFICVICPACAEQWAPLAGTMLVPDEVFQKMVEEVQLEEYGRVLAPNEVAAELDIQESVISKLARERKLLTPKAG